jgi:hypothetical protein
MDQNFASSVASGAKQIGQDAINSFNPTATENNFLSSYNNLNNTQQGQTQDYSDKYAQAVANNPSVTDLYNQGNDKYNVLGLQNTANQLNNAVLTAPQTNLNAAKGFNYDANQLSQQTNQDLARLSPLALAAQNNAQTAQSNANAYVTAGQAQNAQNLLPVQSEQQFYLQQQNNQSQAALQANSQEIAGLTAKMQSGIQLSQAEYARYNQLVQAQASIQSAQAQANAAVDQAKIYAQNQVIAPGSTYYNPTSGQYYNPYSNVMKPA